VQIDIREPATEQEFEEYYRLRYERLRKPQGVPPGGEREGQIEDSSTHLIAEVDGRIVGATSLVVGMRRDPDSGARHVYVRWRNLAIDEEFEGRGIGAALSAAVEERARAIGAKELVGNSRAENVHYFERFGFVAVGPGEDLLGIKHVAIVKRLR
jgi:GNAT superfamily N-acetyltransferase